MPAEVVNAAASDADETSFGTAAGDLLTAAGWHLQRYEALSPTLAEHQWASGDDTRWACFTTPDTDPDAVGSGGWTLARPGDHGKQQRITASANTPAAIVASLALSA
ncbi:hypothetical protein GCM10009839_46380 [Catenulispora yoronensis]|uniref:Uncharacterized protein n=1 Tax=Catenulispora yoronensis TaxID=450799 RepID=A0ABN2UM78_9ACTN